MSLLLDALKKAAEKKARKNAEKRQDADQTRTEIDATAPISRRQAESHIDTTEIDRTQIDQTQVDQTGLDTTEIDRTVADVNHPQSPAAEDTHIDSTELDETAVPKTEFDATDIDTTSPTMTDEDRTLYVYEDETDDAHSTLEMEPVKFLSEQEKGDTEINSLRHISRVDDGERLTEDDVTEFMGDGVHPDTLPPSAGAAGFPRREGSDDTTITNSDSLSLTNIGYDDDDLSLEERQDEVGTDEGDTHSIDVNSIDTSGLRLEDQDDDDERVRAVDSTSTSSTVDIEKLTNDETVTVKDSTGTRTFAPDNYDRTLLKLAETDVSRIFPGLKPESDTIMTPDYAKKVFLNKSHGVKNEYYKAYAILAFIMLLGVLLWGMTELQNESDSIDNSLVRLKRDPMPGIIKPRTEPGQTDLFSQSSAVGERVIDLVANAGDPASAPESGASEVSAEGEEQQPVDMATESAEENGGQAREVSSRGERAAPDRPEPPSGSVATAPVSERSVATATQAPRTTSASAQIRPTSSAPQAETGAQVSSAAGGRLSISSGSRTDPLAQLLAEAYAAYSQGDLVTARRSYDQVLAREASNRDALLGRAAVYIQDNDYESAIRFYQRLLEMNPMDSAAMTSLLSVINIDPAEGESRIKRLLRDQPDSAHLYFALGNMYGSQKRWNEAQSAYFSALQINPEDPNYAYNLAISLEHIAKPEAAVAFYQRALANEAKRGPVSFDTQLVSQRIEVLSQ